MKKLLLILISISTIFIWTSCDGDYYDKSSKYYDSTYDSEIGKSEGGSSVSLDAPMPVTGLEVSANVDNSLEIKWKDPESKENFDHVSVTVTKKDGTVCGSKTVAVDTEKCSFKGLENGFNVTVSVESQNSKNISGQAVKANTLIGGPFIMTYFKSDSGGNPDYESLFFSYSQDGLNYTAMNSNKYVFQVGKDVGSGGQCIRDAYVGRLHTDPEHPEKATFVFMATDWTNYAHSQSEVAARTHPEWGTKGETAYWSVSSPCLIFSKLIIDSEAGTANFYQADGTTPGAYCYRVVTLSDECYAGRGNIQMHAWAPEMIWDFDDDGNPKPVYTDPETGTEYLYGIIWSGDGNLVKNERGSKWDYIHRTYVNYTNDFATFTEPILFYNNDYTYEPVTEIDASISKWNGKYYMFYKNEAAGEKDITVAYSDDLQPLSWKIMHGGQYISRTTDQSVGHGLEGSWQIRVDGTWWMFGDNYASGGSPLGKNNFIGFCTDSIDNSPEKWVEHNNDGAYTFPIGVRHANTCRVSTDELKILLKKYN